MQVEYPLAEAKVLLSSNLAAAKQNLAQLEGELVDAKDSITITEVSIARVFNYDVEQRRAKGGSAKAKK